MRILIVLGLSSFVKYLAESTILEIEAFTLNLFSKQLPRPLDFTFHIWCFNSESNTGFLITKQVLYHLTTEALAEEVRLELTRQLHLTVFKTASVRPTRIILPLVRLTGFEPAQYGVEIQC